MTSTSSTDVEWKKRSVVSSFIFKFDGGQPQVALFRRSDKVSTYRQHLAPISGSINPADASPLAAAWREIREETTLTPESLSLLRQGKSYSFRDESIRREWTVFPFLFRLKTPEDEQRIRIDWEHDGWEWHHPDIVIRDSEGAIGGVPRLAESLRRVWFETDLGPQAGAVLSSGLEALSQDHESGARQLATAALQTLREAIAAMEEPDGKPTEEWWAKVRFMSWHLWKNGRESMGAAIMSALLTALGNIERVVKEVQKTASRRDAVLNQIDHQITARQEAAKLISQAFGAYLARAFPSKLASNQPITILTLSESSTIRQGLRYAALNSGFILDLHILESRPLYEGVSLAGSLAEDLLSTSSASRTHKITLYSDASAALASSAVDLVVLGADRIAASGAVSNKTGSLPAVLSAKHISPRARVVVLGDSDKIGTPGHPEDHVVEDNDDSQISRAWQAEYNSARVRHAATTLQNLKSPESRLKLEIRNVFFEWVSADLIDAYVTESGEWTLQQIAEHSSRLEVEEKRFFESL
ncbi:Methylthioribose-1-phosphate isomerase [Corynascus novoguineensis]|uniref:Methylthioribose-1-phosphate isomerase n=1 Tax=Corynascus novoguineensis TaxID=1126955 RepID=A0AAN7CQL4_9PEZI|nr:Methylthioribose-1-phosphate isomerase [Corynascus novoguineensis]